ncbi:MAG: hypothetical protein JJ900_07760 [Rhodospirillales bacterium]|nr:hypothetical protein [Rhodospirillales bacterium]MBO6786731.1 hypothetical protein [Rhodospirillales bacterium]
MSPEAADILRFLAFGLVWLFPVALVVAVLGFASADAKSRREEMGPNVVAFPAPKPPEASQKPNWLSRVKRLAIRAANR